MGQPFYRTRAAKLAALAFLSLLLILVLLRPAGHDPDWWRRAGLKERHPGAERVVFSDDGNVLEANVKHEHHVSIVGDHDNGMPPKRNDLPPPTQAPAETKKARPVMRPLKEGEVYFADYDISKVVMDPDPTLKPGQSSPYFSYIDPEMNDEYAMKYVSNKPRVLLIQDFMTPAECDALVEAASHKLFRSQVAPMLNSKQSSVNEVRTSQQAWLSATSAEVKPIVDRILKLTGFPRGSNEELQVLRYGQSQKYDAHNDYFDPKMYGAQTTNRAVTVFLYLSDVEEGGETQFPRADGKPPTFDFVSCNRGLRVRPRKGQAALFYDMKPNGELDPFSLHGGCPVKQGVKWGGTLWLRVPTGGF